MTQWNQVWSQLAAGQHVLAIDPGPVPAPSQAELAPIEVDCAFVPHPGGCLEEARRLVDKRMLAEPQALLHSAISQMRQGVRRHLLSEPPRTAELARFAESFGRAADTHPRTVLVLRSLDRADARSLSLLRAMLLGPLGLPLPTLFCFDSNEVEGEAKALLDALRGRVAESEPRRPGAPSSAAAPETSTFDALPHEVKTTLRAAATVGQRFESETLAKLLDRPETAVLLDLQRATDTGVPLQDRGRGRFFLAPEYAECVSRRTLPSLTHHWHQRLGELFGGTPAPFLHPEPEVAEQRLDSAPPKAKARAAAPRARLLPEQIFQHEPRETPHESSDDRDWQRALGQLESEPAESDRPTALPDGRAGASRDGYRAATHAEAAGDHALAIVNYLDAAGHAASTGAHQLAIQYAERAEQLLERLPGDARQHHLKLETKLLLAQSRWLGGGNETLDSALQTLESARKLLQVSRDAKRWVRYATLFASICYDMGTQQSLENALQELTRTGKRLLEAGHPLLAAELLNDEAALWVRIGDPVRAHHLLHRSREIFSKVIASHPSARRELAETEHLMARLMLHARARPGREHDALRLGIEHALSAEESYLALDNRLELGRVRETLGRLEAGLEHHERALEHLAEARHEQLELGDSVGLARSSGALAEVLCQLGEHRRALEQLSESIQLNTRKGSIAGLGYNLESLERLRPALPAELRKPAESLEHQLRQLLE